LFSYSLLSFDSSMLALLMAIVCGICFGIACWRQLPLLATIMAGSSILSGITAFALFRYGMMQRFNAMNASTPMYDNLGMLRWLPLALFGFGIATIIYGICTINLKPSGVMPFRALSAMMFVALGATLVLLSPQTGAQLAIVSGTARDHGFWSILLFIAEHMHTALLVVLVPTMLITALFAFKRYKIHRCYGHYYAMRRPQPLSQR
jgi:hypothetical protein